MYCPNVAVSIFGGPESALKHIGYMAFGYAGSSTVTSITINANAMLNALSESYGYRTFYDGYAGVTDLYLRNGQTLNVDNIASNLFGRDSNITVHQEF